MELARYVVLNPVRAKAVLHPRLWKWSSYRATSREARVPDFLTTDWILAQFRSKRELPQRGYRRFVAEGRGARRLGGPARWGAPGERCVREEALSTRFMARQSRRRSRKRSGARRGRPSRSSSRGRQRTRPSATGRSTRPSCATATLRARSRATLISTTRPSAGS